MSERSEPTIVVVERSFEEARTFDELQAAENAVAWCLEQHRVRFLRSYLSLDARSMVCIYEAPDADAVRETQRRGGLPVARLWPAQVLGSTGRHQARPGFSTVVVERELPQPTPIEDIEQLIAASGGCLATNRAELLESKLSFDRTRMLCVYGAPDAEAVRRANRQLGAVVTRAWTATVHSA
jgi:hypothetical protein